VNRSPSQRITLLRVAIFAAFLGCQHGPTSENTAKSPLLSTSDRADNDPYFKETPSPYESIYIFRSLPERVVTPISTFCDNAGFVSTSENVFSLWSLDSEKHTGRLTYAHRMQIGELHVCTGPSDNPTALNFYAMGSIDHIPVVAKGVTTIVKKDFPAKGDTVREVAAAVSAPGYISGQFATNTIRSSTRGYVVSSIGTLRLWSAP
jgi:hypothetical protein